jgi:aspartyl-tRNA(Asn)/glutamyl-tRNA(Gln) amidotransferase subunit A
MSDPATILSLRAQIEHGDTTPAEIIDKHLATIDAWEPHLNAFIEVFSDEAKSVARNNPIGSLAGIPIAIKDLISTVEGHTRAASQMLARYRAPFDATVIKRLKQAGAILIGKTNQDEFAMGASNEYSSYGSVKNPWDLTRVPGGSSGGSAAAVAAGEVPAALGTDTGGSVRQPSSLCGVVGLKPTYGRLSRFGVIAYASSFDQVGPITRTVLDNALLMDVIAGPDEWDATTHPIAPSSYTAACQQGVKDLTIGIPQQYFGEEVDPQISATVRQAINDLKKQGAKVKDISLPLLHAAIPTYYLLVKAEASSNLARYDGLRYGSVDIKGATLLDAYLESRGRYLGPEVKRSILMGTYALSAGYVDAWYKQASRVRTLIRREFENAFKEVDVIVGPVSPETAFPLNSKSDDPFKMYLADLLTVPASVAGLPAISVPCGFVNQLPVGLQIIAPHFQENRIYQTAAAYEQLNNWWQQTPDLPA